MSRTRMATGLSVLGVAAQLTVLAPAVQAAQQDTVKPDVAARTAAASTAAAPCGLSPSDGDRSTYRRTFGGNFINMRSGPGTNCGAKGQAQASQYADYHCFVHQGGDTWTYLRNVSTGVHGWVRDDLLTDGGSAIRC